ncbi:MAG: AI-2E family transporter, partial [Pseudomonadota bacterium]
IAGIFFVGQFIEGNFIAPKLMGDSVGMHPLWIIFVLMAGGSLMGLMGMFLAVPIAASVGVLAGFALDEYKKSRYFHEL